MSDLHRIYVCAHLYRHWEYGCFLPNPSEVHNASGLDSDPPMRPLCAPVSTNHELHVCMYVPVWHMLECAVASYHANTGRWGGLSIINCVVGRQLLTQTCLALQAKWESCFSHPVFIKIFCISPFSYETRFHKKKVTVISLLLWDLFINARAVSRNLCFWLSAKPC